MTYRFARSGRAPRVHSTDIPDSPPPEVLEAIAAAHATSEQLEASGRHVRFDLDAARGLICELTDGEGVALHSLSARAVLDLATGATAPE